MPAWDTFAALNTDNCGGAEGVGIATFEAFQQQTVANGLLAIVSAVSNVSVELNECVESTNISANIIPAPPVMVPADPAPIAIITNTPPVPTAAQATTTPTTTTPTTTTPATTTPATTTPATTTPATTTPATTTPATTTPATTTPTNTSPTPTPTPTPTTTTTATVACNSQCALTSRRCHGGFFTGTSSCCDPAASCVLNENLGVGTCRLETDAASITVSCT
eukprot:jgi/Ulvmu1/5461/UM228_0003.1